MLDDLRGNGLILHHWDTDGICSARLLLGYLSDKDLINRTPVLGNYYLTQRELEEYGNFDFIIIADMSLPREDVLALAEKAKIGIFDHHLGREIKEVFHYNPVIKGGDPDCYPSASWIINSFLGNDPNLFAFLGVVGDHEKRIQDNPVFSSLLTDFCQEKDIRFDDLVTMVQLLDSNYKMGDKKEVENTPRFLLNKGSPQDILNHKEWQKNLTDLTVAIEKQLREAPEEINNILIKRMHTPYNIISTVTRKIFWDTGKTTMVINTGFFEEFDQFYVRSNKPLEKLIEKGKQNGFKCGGKREVFGAIVPRNKTENFMTHVIKFLI
mgnify:CR=1 FL=1